MDIIPHGTGLETGSRELLTGIICSADNVCLECYAAASTKKHKRIASFLRRASTKIPK